VASTCCRDGAASALHCMGPAAVMASACSRDCAASALHKNMNKFSSCSKVPKQGSSCNILPSTAC
jgi:hypothetical protein